MSEHIEVEQDKVILNPHLLGKFLAALYTLAYLVTMAATLLAVVVRISEGRSPLASFAAILVWTALWAYLMRNYQSRVIFDGGAQKVYRRTVLGYKEVMDFADIGGVTPVTSTYQGSEVGTAYSLVRKGDRFGKGIRVSKCFNKKLELDAYEKDDLPQLFALLDRHAEAIDVPQPEVGHRLDAGGLPEGTVYFRRKGNVFSRPYRFRWLVLGALFFGCLIGALHTGGANRDTLLFAAACIGAVSFLSPTRLVLDAGERQVKQYWGWGLLKRVHPFGAFRRFNASRESVNFIPVGTYVHMVMHNPKKPDRPIRLLIGQGYSTRLFDRISEEIRLILGDAAVDGEKS